MNAAPDPKTVREIAKDAIRRAMNSRPAEYVEAACIAHGGIGLVLSESFDAYTKAVAAECDRLTAAHVPDGQPAAEQDGGWARHAVELLTAVVDPECNSDSYGNCATHGVLVLEAGAQCPHALARAFLAGSRAHLAAMAAEQDGDVRVYPGKPGDGWQDDDGTVWIHCADGQMRMMAPETVAWDPAAVDDAYGPMDPLDVQNVQSAPRLKRCPCGCKGGPDDCTCGGACRCSDCPHCDLRAAAEAEAALDARDADGGAS